RAVAGRIEIEAGHLVAFLDEAREHARADGAEGAGEENLHSARVPEGVGARKGRPLPNAYERCHARGRCSSESPSSHSASTISTPPSASNETGSASPPTGSSAKNSSTAPSRSSISSRACA